MDLNSDGMRAPTVVPLQRRGQGNQYRFGSQAAGERYNLAMNPLRNQMDMENIVIAAGTREKEQRRGHGFECINGRIIEKGTPICWN
jgi:hypothetical protein